MDKGNISSHTRIRLDQLCWFLSYHRVVVLLLILVITGVFLFGALKIRGEVVLQELFPYDHPYLKLHARFAQVFGSGASGVAIALKARNGDIFNQRFLTKLQGMTEEVQYWDEVYRSLTLSIAARSVKVVKPGALGEIKIESLMWPEVPKDDQEMALLKKNIFSERSYNGTIVSKDGTGVLLLTEFRENISYERVFNLLQKLRKDYTDAESSVHIVGFPTLMGWIYSLKQQTYLVFGISIVLMILILYIIFRNVTGMIVPIIDAAILTIIGLGFVGFTGINFSPLLYVLAFFVGARFISNSVQITHRYFEEFNASGDDRVRACYETMRSMLFPNWAGVFTDVAGFAVLSLAKIVLMQHLAIIMGFWIFSTGLTGIMVPIICSALPLKVASDKYAREKSQMDWQARAITKVTSFSIGSGRYVVVALIVAASIFFSWQISKLKIGDSTPGSPILWSDHTYNQDQALINKIFNASSENLMLFYEGEKGSVYDPIVLNTFDAFSSHMKGHLPDIYKSSSSISDMTRMVNLILHDGDYLWYQLPRNDTMLTCLMGWVRGHSDPATIIRFMDPPKERAQITLFFADHTSENLLRIREAAYDYFKDRPMKIEKGEFKLAGGRIGLEIGLNEEMKRAHVAIDSCVLAAIFILICISFMSITGGLMITLPLIFANSMAFAYMALMGIGLSINTLPIAAVGVGVGDNFCIYLYSRCMEEYRLQGGDWKKAIIQSVCTTGKAVVYTGLTIILPVLTWYFFSDMKFQGEMGFFLAVILGANVLLTLTLHPLLIYIIKPKFISGKNKALRASEARVITGMHSV